jgi:predicted amidophosphoribosyltransferase
MELTAEVRRENIKEVFVCQNKNLIKEKKILLVDDVFTTGSTMEECARVLKNSGAKEVWGIAVARE